MSEQLVAFTAVMTVVVATLRRTVRGVLPAGPDEGDVMSDGPMRGDRGAVSIEHVLWYAAAAISVAVIATIIWNQVKTTASTTVQSPSAP
jgi:hypothetical protein